ncbi:hypothetical protein ACXZ1K_13510 [Pedobacter sp. PWIIR3]
MLNLRLILLFFLLTICAFRLSAQQRIALNDVLKIELIKTPGGLGDPRDYHKYEITNENGIWVSNKILRPSGKVFFSNVGAEKINELLSFMAATDTEIHIEQFKLNNAEMELAFDSINKSEFLELDQKQKTKFLKKFSKVLPESLEGSLLHPEGYDDRALTFIRVTTKDGHTKSIQALSGNYYNLPWDVNGKPVYNPEISRLFAELADDKQFDKQAKTFLYSISMLTFYWRKYATHFNMENLKRDYPLYFKKTGSSLQVKQANKSNRGWTLTLASSKLPSRISLGGQSLKHLDKALPALELLEARIINLYRSNNYLFKYLRQNSHQGAFIHVKELYDNDDTSFWILENLKRLYSPVAFITPQQVTIIEIGSLAGISVKKGDAMWLLLPDDSFICVPYIVTSTGYEVGRTAFIYAKNGQLIKTVKFN